MKMLFALRRLALVVRLCLLGTPLGYAESGSDSGDANLSLKENVLCNGLITTWLTTLSYDSIPENVRKISALNLYAFLFQYWLVTEHQGKKNSLLDKHEVPFIMSHVKAYVVLDDPMGIAPFYEGDTLNTVGSSRAALQPLLHADDIFEKKQIYQKLVVEFEQWRDSQ